MITEIELLPNASDGTDDGYDPALTLEYDASTHELFVSVGEEMTGMVESLPERTWERLVAKLVTA